SERIPLSAKDAFILSIYCLLRSWQIDPLYVPYLFAQRVQRVPLPTVDEMLGMADTRYLSRERVINIRDTAPVIETIITTEDFYNKCLEIQAAANAQRIMATSLEHYES